MKAAAAMATIVLIPGAWITPSFYQPFLDAARAVGFPVHHANYPSLNPSDPFTADCQKDSDVLESTIRPLVEDQGLDVLLFMHSYAGMPGASAAVGLSKTERAKKGKAGGIIGLVFIAAFVVPENVSCAGLMGGSLPPWIVLDDVRSAPSPLRPHCPAAQISPSLLRCLPWILS